MPSGRLTDVQAAVVLVTAAATPLAFSTWTIDVFNLTALTVLWVGTIAAWGLEFAIRGVRLPRPPMGWQVIAAYLAILLLATALSRAPAVSALGNYGRYGGLATIVPALALAWLFGSIVASSPERRRWAMQALAASGLIGALYVWTQQLGIDGWAWLEPWQEEPRHPPGALGNSNFSGAHLAMAGIPTVVLAVRSSGLRRWLWAAAAIVVLSGVGVSQSRGAMLAAVAGFAVLGWRNVRRRPSIAAAMAIALVAVGIAAVATNEGGVDELAGTRTFDERVDLWEVALRGARDNPIIGGGPDLYRLTFEEHAGESLAGVVADEPHNVLLDHLDGAGFLGAAAWLAVAATTVELYRRRPEADVVWAAMGAAYLTQSMLSIDVVPLILWGWLVVGAIWVDHVPRPEQPLRPIGQAAVGVVAVAAMVLSLGPFRADMAHRRAIEASNRGDTTSAVFQLEQAVDRHGWEPRFHRRLGIQYALAARAGDVAAVDLAAASLDRALELLPGDPIAEEWRRLVGPPN